MDMRISFRVTSHRKRPFMVYLREFAVTQQPFIQIYIALLSSREVTTKMQPTWGNI